MKNTKEVLAFAFSLHMAIDKANEDGKIDIQDVGLLIEPVTKLIPAVQDIKLCKEELANATPEEKAELHAWVAATYDIADDKLEAKVEEGVNVVVAVATFLGKM